MINKQAKNLFVKCPSLYIKPSKKYYYATHLVTKGKEKVVGGWLFLAAAGVLGMIVLGGYTRLTHSGLSMADWSPYTKRYPRNQQQWNQQFDKYKQCIQYQTVNKDITLEGFKPIYNIQFAHRAVGMYLGYYFMIPFGYFLYKGYLTPKFRNRLLFLLGLGGLQGFIGWWMVKSGLKEKPSYQTRPRVSPYRLMTHLMMATTIYSGLIWHSFALLLPPTSVEPSDLDKLKYLRKTRILGIILIKCLLLNMLTGALVAGIDAGKVYNTWPLMNGKFFPPSSFSIQPLWKNFFENQALVQFNHRIMAYITESVSVYLLYTILKNKMHHPASFAGIFAFVLINYQALSGIITLLNLVPANKANQHQMSAVLNINFGNFDGLFNKTASNMIDKLICQYQ